MARTPIRLGDNAPEPQEVYLFEHKYLLRKFTRSVEKAVVAADAKMQALDDPTSDKVVPLLAEGLAAMLMNNGTESPDVKKLLVGAWKDDKLGLPELRALYDDMQEAAFDRPT